MDATCNCHAIPTRHLTSSFMSTNPAGQTVWMYPATSKTSKYILHYLQSKQQNTSGTAACILLPSSQSKLHSQSLQHMTLLKEYPADAPIFTSTNQSTPTSVPYPLQLWYDAPLPLPPAICSVTAPSKMCFVAKANGRLCTARLDTGASDIFIDKSFAERHSLPITILPNSRWHIDTSYWHVFFHPKPRRQTATTGSSSCAAWTCGGRPVAYW